MLHALSWMLVCALLALWSLLAWAMHALGTWTIANADALTGAVPGIDAPRLPEWLAPWIPPEAEAALASLQSGLIPAVGTLLDQAPALAEGWSVAIWVLWGIGGVLLVALGMFAHMLITVVRRRMGRMRTYTAPQSR